MAITKETEWRVRAGGNADNGGGFDPTIGSVGAVDQTDQDAAALTLTDLATPGAGSTTLTSVTGGFTDAMLDNYFHIKSGTNFTAGYYRMTARASSTSCTVDRSPTPGGAGSAGTGSLGGALDMVRSIANETLAADLRCVPGNTIHVRGAGTQHPAVDDYDESTSAHFNCVEGNTTDGWVKIIGYNGRPRILTQGLWLNDANFVHLENLYLVPGGSVLNPTLGIISQVVGGNALCVRGCYLSQGNTLAMKGILANHARILDTEFYGGSDTPTQTAGRYAVENNTGVLHIFDCYFHHCIDDAIFSEYLNGTIEGCIIYKCKGDGIHVDTTSLGTWPNTIKNNTIDANEGHGINIDDALALTSTQIFNNILSNHTGTGKKGINVVTGSAAANDLLKTFIDYNNFYNNTAHRGNLNAGDNDLNVDPTYGGAASEDWEVGTNLKALGFPAANIGAQGSATRSYVDVGAAQREEPAGGSGGGVKLAGPGGGIAG